MYKINVTEAYLFNELFTFSSFELFDMLYACMCRIELPNILCENLVNDVKLRKKPNNRDIDGKYILS